MRDNEKLDDDLRRFVEEVVPSVPCVEALLLLRAGQERAWDARRLARRLYLSDQAAARLLEQLHQAGLLAPAPQHGPEAWVFCPATEGLAQLAARLLDVYPRRLVEISNLIHAANARRSTGRD